MDSTPPGPDGKSPGPLEPWPLPPRGELLADIARERAAMRRRYVASRRHTMQVDYDDYLYALRRERARGARRASAFAPA